MLAIAAGIGAVLAAFVIRSAQSHVGLLYPDGYQYLLVARGLAEHLGPTTRLGPGGDLFVPSLDAAAKPLYPALIALADRFGADPLVAARTITELAAAAVVVLAGALVLRLTASAAAGVFASAACLLSPTLTFWSGFAGVDPLAQALALASGLACAFRRIALAGALAGLAVATRPELAVVAVAATLAGLVSSRFRGDAVRAGTAGLVSTSAVFLAVHPGLGLPSGTLVLAGVVATLAAAVAIAAASVARWVAPGAATLAAVLLVSSPAGVRLGRAEGLLLAVALAGTVLVPWNGTERRAVGVMSVAAASLVAVYTLKNPNSDRYLGILIPVSAVAAGMTIARLGTQPKRLALAGAIGGAVLVAAVLAPSRPEVGPDAFALLASELTDRPSLPLLTAAPDAYGWLLSERGVRQLRPGERGLILLDGAQRLYAPELTARGTEIATFDEAIFLRPDGTADTQRVRLIEGVVVPRSARR